MRGRSGILIFLGEGYSASDQFVAESFGVQVASGIAGGSD
uniref:Uncharacterized protein n=1 Tax=Arundo donax TaxID=35708 RepID=A0A0A8XW81_ARUDO